MALTMLKAKTTVSITSLRHAGNKQHKTYYKHLTNSRIRNQETMFGTDSLYNVSPQNWEDLENISLPSLPFLQFPETPLEDEADQSGRVYYCHCSYISTFCCIMLYYKPKCSSIKSAVLPYFRPSLCISKINAVILKQKATH